MQMVILLWLLTTGAVLLGLDDIARCAALAAAGLLALIAGALLVSILAFLFRPTHKLFADPG